MSEQRDLRIRQVARFFYALKDPLRLRIFLTLGQTDEMTVSDLVHVVRVSQPLVSWHLAQLRNAGLVRVERDGRIARYSVDLETVERQLTAFRTLLGGIPGAKARSDEE